MTDLSNDCPKAIAHLNGPYDDGVSDYVLIAEISAASKNGHEGFRKIRTALVPIDMLDDILKAPGGIGCEVQSWGTSSLR
jgi:hypothetical protein